MVKIDIKKIELKTLRQTDIDDAGKNELCLVYSGLRVAYQLRRRLEAKKGVKLPDLDMPDIDRMIDECVANGGVKTHDKKNSWHGLAADHVKIAEAAGLFGYEKEYVKIGKNPDGSFDCSFICALLQWDSLVELRDEGRHSLLATGWYLEGTTVYCTTSDPWPYSDDLRFNTKTAMTERKVNGKWTPSRSIEFFAWYYKRGTNPKWIE